MGGVGLTAGVLGSGVHRTSEEPWCAARLSLWFRAGICRELELVRTGPSSQGRGRLGVWVLSYWRIKATS